MLLASFRAIDLLTVDVLPIDVLSWDYLVKLFCQQVTNVKFCREVSLFQRLFLKLEREPIKDLLNSLTLHLNVPH